jgi:alpha-glucosidase
LWRALTLADDVSDYRDVDPRIGTLSDFEEMTSKLKDSGIKVIVDIVPNHSSDEHEWFQAALIAGKGSKERARFHFQDGLGPDKSSPPSDWQGAFGGPCWTKSGMDDGQWYFHMFDKSQPDFNWENPDVRQDFLETLRFWGTKGVAGFRIDVAAACTKDLGKDMLLLPWDEVLGRRMRKSKHGNRGEEIDHPFFDRDETLEIYKEWREVFNEFDPPLW